MKQRTMNNTLAGAALLLGAAGVQAQMVNYAEALNAYRDSRDSGVKLNEATFYGVQAKARINFALTRDQVVDVRDLKTAPDGSLILPDGQSNVVIRTNANDVTTDAGGTVRIASPTIQGPVNGSVTVYVDGRPLDNVTVINNRR